MELDSGILGLQVKVKNGSLNTTVMSGSVISRGCEEHVNVQLPKNKLPEDKQKADRAEKELGGEQPVLKAIKLNFVHCDEHLCNSALDIGPPGFLILLPFVLLGLNLL